MIIRKRRLCSLHPLFKANVWRHFGLKATKIHQLLWIATIHPCFYFCFVLLSEMLRLTLMYSLYRDMYRIVTPVSGYYRTVTPVSWYVSYRDPCIGIRIVPWPLYRDMYRTVTPVSGYVSYRDPCIVICIVPWLLYRDMYRTVTPVSGYVSYHEIVGNAQVCYRYLQNFILNWQCIQKLTTILSKVNVRIYKVN